MEDVLPVTGTGRFSEYGSVPKRMTPVKRLLSCLALVGFLLTGCTPESTSKPTGPTPTKVTPPPTKSDLDKAKSDADKAKADADKAKADADKAKMDKEKKIKD